MKLVAKCMSLSSELCPLNFDFRFDGFVRDIDPQIPVIATVFEYFVDPASLTWVHWESKLSDSYKPPQRPFFKILVPTMDTVRNTFLISALVNAYENVLVVGGVGNGKTMSITHVLENLPNERSKTILNFSAQTSSNSFQDTIENCLEKRTKGVFGPVGGKKLVAFIDDLNMPQKSPFGFIPPLELLKLWNDYGFWFDRRKCEEHQIKDVRLVAAMAPPGGGRHPFSQRIQSCFSLLNINEPSDKQLHRIYATLLNNGLVQFDHEVRSMADKIVQATIDLYRSRLPELRFLR